MTERRSKPAASDAVAVPSSARVGSRESTTGEGSALKIEVYGKAAKARWRMKASNGQTVASSGEAFSSHGNAERAAKSFVKGAANAELQVYADRGGKYRWRAKSSNGQTVASSGESFASKASAQRAARNVQAKAGAASGPE